MLPNLLCNLRRRCVIAGPFARKQNPKPAGAAILLDLMRERWIIGDGAKRAFDEVDLKLAAGGIIACWIAFRHRHRGEQRLHLIQ